MAVPKSKISKSRRGMRRSHDALKPINISVDSKTGEPKLSHHISLVDGMYNGRQVLAPKVKKDKNAEEAATESKEIAAKVDAAKKVIAKEEAPKAKSAKAEPKAKSAKAEPKAKEATAAADKPKAKAAKKTTDAKKA